MECEVVQVRLAELTLHAPRQWGACWLALTLWERLELDRSGDLPASREGTRFGYCEDSGLLPPYRPAATGVFIGSGTNTVHCAICWDVTG